MKTRTRAGSRLARRPRASAGAVTLVALTLLGLSAPTSAAGPRHRASVGTAQRKPRNTKAEYPRDKKFEYKGVVGGSMPILAKINVNCGDKFTDHLGRPRGYVARRPGDPNSVLNHPHVQSNLKGGDSGGVTTWAPTASVRWPDRRIGSRLATAIRVDVQANQTRRPVDYDVVVWCADAIYPGKHTSGAWIIVG